MRWGFKTQAANAALASRAAHSPARVRRTRRVMATLYSIFTNAKTPLDEGGIFDYNVREKIVRPEYEEAHNGSI